MSSTLVALLALTSAILVGIHLVLVKRALRTSTALTASVFTTGVNVIILGAVYLLVLPAPPRGEAVWFFVIAGLLAPGLARTFNFISVDRIGASAGSTLSNTSPLFALPLAPLILQEKLDVYIAIGAALIVLGVVSVGVESEDISKPNMSKKGRYAMTGFVMGLLAALLYALSFTARKLGMNVTQAPGLGALVTTGTSLLLLSLLLALSKRLRMRLALDRNSLGLLFLAGIASSIAWILQFLAFGSGEAIMVIPLLETAPLFTLFLGFLLLRGQEPVTGKIALAAVAVVAGAIITAFR